MTGTQKRTSRWRIIAAAVVVALIAAAAYAAVPRHADLRAFVPGRMAARETAMWRHYYDKSYVALFLDLYETGRVEFGYSPWDSLRLAVTAAQAARKFQPTHLRAEAQLALPDLRAYYAIVARAAPVTVDLDEAARTELDWWQARRESVPPEQYGITIARVTTLTYEVTGDDVRASGILRAQAMAYCDAHNPNFTEADWVAIEEKLRAAYTELKDAVAR